MSLPFAGPVRHVYVHVPFCRERCDYCDFASVAVGPPAGGGGEAVAPAAEREDPVDGHVAEREDLPDSHLAEREDLLDGHVAEREDLLDGYVAAVLAQWERERVVHGVRRLETLYFGGGTPSLLGTARLGRLLAAFEPFLTPAAEITVETNPEDVDEAYARWAAAAPVSSTGAPARGVRVSLGVQSFDPRLRAALGRRATADPAAAFRRLRAAGVRDLSVDLIHGIPGQTLADLEDDLAAVLDLRPDHVSWYELDVVEGTALAARLRRLAAVPQPGDDERAAMYRRIVRALSRAGYAWYEVSSFALPGHRARHNAAYWRARPYLGLGVGAVATVGRRRTTTTRDLEVYLAALTRGEAPPCEVEELSAIDLARERLMLAARCGLRVPLGEVAAALAPEALPPLVEAGMVSLHGGTIAVTRKGRYVANEVSVRLFRV